MALLPSQTTTTTYTPLSSRQIVLNNAPGGYSGTILYTVPDGKTFVGYFYPGYVSGTFYINNTTVTYNGTFLIPLTLVGGTILKSGQTTGVFSGIEQ